MDQNTGSSNDLQQTSAQWAEIIGQLFDRLTGKGATVSYTFDNLVVDIPKSQGPGGQNMGSAKWTINGKVILTAETHQTPDSLRRSVSTTA